MNHTLQLTCRLRVCYIQRNARGEYIASMLAFWFLRRLRSLRTCLRRLRITVLDGLALRWMETQRYLDEQVANNNHNRKRLN